MSDTSKNDEYRAAVVPRRGLPGERLLAKLAERFLIERGWIVQVNKPGRGWWTDVEGWRPLHSQRYGKSPLYRGVVGDRLELRD